MDEEVVCSAEDEGVGIGVLWVGFFVWGRGLLISDKEGLSGVLGKEVTGNEIRGEVKELMIEEKV